MIKKLDLLSFDENKFTFKCLVSKGTYIRSLIRDILNDLNVIGTMSSLTRTKQGVFDIKDAYTLDDVRNGNYKLLKIKDVLDIPVVKIDDSLKSKVLNGVRLKGNYLDKVLFLDENDEEMAIYKKDKDEYKVEVMLK